MILQEARGFVDFFSFISGQTTKQYFSSMGGREGLIDTAVKTSETGYLQRKLVKSMEDLKVDYGYSVRNNSGCIVQFIYGEDGMDSICVESQNLMIMEMNTDEICKKFLYEKKTQWKKILTKDAIKNIKKGDDDIIEKDFSNFLIIKNIYLIIVLLMEKLQMKLNIQYILKELQKYL